MIKRESYMRQIRPFIGNDLVKVLTGIRRCGKSVMLNLIQEELIARGIPQKQIISINFEQMVNAPHCTAEALHKEILQLCANIEGKVYLFFDEIQEVAEWEKCISSLRLDLDCDIYLTGSNAKLLSGDLATYLGGRYVEFVIYPFSFAEFVELYSTVYPGEPITRCFQKYLTEGGMPFLSNLDFEDDPSRKYLEDLYGSIVLKDIVKRNKVRDVDLLIRIITYVMTNVGSNFSATSISNFLKNEHRTVATDTILNYLRYCDNAYLVYQAKRQDLQANQVLSTNGKFYVADHGLRQAIFGGKMKDINLILENIVYMELLRRQYDVTVGKNGDQEIDFICTRHGEKLYVQVCYLLASDDAVEHEFGVYSSIPDNYPKYVVSMDEFDMSQNGIKHKNIRDFLLAESWS